MGNGLTMSLEELNGLYPGCMSHEGDVGSKKFASERGMHYEN